MICVKADETVNSVNAIYNMLSTPLLQCSFLQSRGGVRIAANTEWMLIVNYLIGSRGNPTAWLPVWFPEENTDADSHRGDMLSGGAGTSGFTL